MNPFTYIEDAHMAVAEVVEVGRLDTARWAAVAVGVGESLRRNCTTLGEVAEGRPRMAVASAGVGTHFASVAGEGGKHIDLAAEAAVRRIDLTEVRVVVSRHIVTNPASQG
jgi:hypothetical protein